MHCIVHMEEGSVAKQNLEFVGYEVLIFIFLQLFLTIIRI